MLSHLGSGAELTGWTLDAALRGVEPEPRDNQAVWDRWNAMSPVEQAESFLDFSERVVVTLEGLDADDRADLRFPLPFLPEPADVSTVVALRLNELTLHGWDVLVMDDPATPLTPSSVDLLVDRAGVLIGFIGHPDVVEPRPVTLRVVTEAPPRQIGLELADKAALVEPPIAADQAGRDDAAGRSVPAPGGWSSGSGAHARRHHRGRADRSRPTPPGLPRLLRPVRGGRPAGAGRTPR